MNPLVIAVVAAAITLLGLLGNWAMSAYYYGQLTQTVVENTRRIGELEPKVDRHSEDLAAVKQAVKMKATSA